MTHLLRRLTKLEANESLTGPRTPMERLEAALDEAAFRVAGKSWSATAGDPKNCDAVFKDVFQNFITHLERADVRTLMVTFEDRLFGNDPVAIENARRKALAFP